MFSFIFITVQLFSREDYKWISEVVNILKERHVNNEMSNMVDCHQILQVSLFVRLWQFFYFGPKAVKPIGESTCETVCLANCV